MVTLYKILENPTLSSFNLETNNADLTRKVSNVCILDYEFEPSSGKIEDNIFYENELILSSLQVAKTDESIFYDIVKNLIDIGVAGLAVKKIFYDDIPQKILDLANEYHFPIFTFEKSLYYENIIVPVMQEIKHSEEVSLYEKYIDKIMSENISNDEAFRLLQLKNDSYYIFMIDGNVLNSKIDYSKSEIIVKAYNYYSYTLLIIKKTYDITYYLDYFNDVLDKTYHLGYSNSGDSLSKGFNNAFNSLKVAKMNEVPYINNYEDKYYSFLVENYRLSSFQTFMNNFLKNVIDDEILMDSLCEYVKNNFDIQQSAKQMNIHENTLRYRIEKAMHLIDENALRDEFKINLALAITIYNLNNLD